MYYPPTAYTYYAPRIARERRSPQGAPMLLLTDRDFFRMEMRFAAGRKKKSARRSAIAVWLGSDLAGASHVWIWECVCVLCCAAFTANECLL